MHGGGGGGTLARHQHHHHHHCSCEEHNYCGPSPLLTPSIPSLNMYYTPLVYMQAMEEHLWWILTPPYIFHETVYRVKNFETHTLLARTEPHSDMVYGESAGWDIILSLRRLLLLKE